MIKWFLDHGSDVNTTGWSTISPLMSASVNGHREVIKYLLQSGADPTYRNKDGLTALDMVKEDERTMVKNKRRFASNKDAIIALLEEAERQSKSPSDVEN